ncbi:MAG: MMPL family transporter, partial [Acidimicrobiales bacterium]
FMATLGATVLVFLNAGGLEGLDFSTPIVLYLFVLAIGTDYNILASERLREEFMGGRSPVDAARATIIHGGPAVWAAGVILAGTFASLLLTGIASLTELGFGVSAGIVIAAFIMSPTLVPAISILQGRYFWWPSSRRREHEAQPERSVTV